MEGGCHAGFEVVAGSRHPGNLGRQLQPDPGKLPLPGEPLAQDFGSEGARSRSPDGKRPGEHRKKLVRCGIFSQAKIDPVIACAGGKW